MKFPPVLLEVNARVDDVVVPASLLVCCTSEMGPPAARLVSEKFTVDRPVAAAVTAYGPPAVAFAVKGADAMPEASVATVIAAVLLLNTPEAPEGGAVKVTFTPETGLLPASLTVTANAPAKAVLIVADCG